MKMLTLPGPPTHLLSEAEYFLKNPYLKRSSFRAIWARRRTGRQLSLQAFPLLSPVQLSTRYGTWLPIYNWGYKQCCGAESRGAEIKLPPVAGVKITHWGSGSFLFTTDLKKVDRKNHVCWRSFWKLLLYNFNLITEVKVANFQGILATIWSWGWRRSRSRKKYFRLRNSGWKFPNGELLMSRIQILIYQLRTIDPEPDLNPTLWVVTATGFLHIFMAY